MFDELMEGQPIFNELIEVTPDRYRCPAVPNTCPSVFVTPDGEHYVIVGKMVTDPDTLVDLKGRIGEGETAIEVPIGLMGGEAGGA